MCKIYCCHHFYCYFMWFALWKSWYNKRTVESCNRLPTYGSWQSPPLMTLYSSRTVSTCYNTSLNSIPNISNNPIHLLGAIIHLIPTLIVTVKFIYCQILYFCYWLTFSALIQPMMFMKFLYSFLLHFGYFCLILFCYHQFFCLNNSFIFQCFYYFYFPQWCCYHQFVQHQDPNHRLIIVDIFA